MTRSKWKGPYVNPNDLQNLIKNHHTYTMSRDTEIIPKFIGVNFRVYNGKNYLTITPTVKMLGHKFGEFIFTRSEFSFKKKNKK